MSIFDGFRAPRLTHPRLGELRYARGRWTSEAASCFGATAVALRIPGTRDAIDPDALALLERVEAEYPRIKAEALPHFHEHYAPFAEAVGALDEREAALVRTIRTPEDLWPHLELVRVWVGAYGKPGDVELGYETAWDIEHMLGLTVSAGHVTGFCASIGPWS